MALCLVISTSWHHVRCYIVENSVLFYYFWIAFCTGYTDNNILSSSISAFNLALYFKLRGFFLNLYPQQGHEKRTARAGATGKAITLVSQDRVDDFSRILKKTKQPIRRLNEGMGIMVPIIK